eukprot:6180076-Pleurochrysis_carterae.AAC.1
MRGKEGTHAARSERKGARDWKELHWKARGNHAGVGGGGQRSFHRSSKSWLSFSSLRAGDDGTMSSDSRECAIVAPSSKKIELKTSRELNARARKIQISQNHANLRLGFLQPSIKLP